MLYIQLLEKMSLIALAAYSFSRTRMFRNLIKDKLDLTDKVIMIVFFSTLSLLGNYLGIDVGMHAYANTRPIGAIVAGYVGGPLIGMVVGTIAGVQRYFLGGFTALACAMSTVAEGLIGGLVGKHSDKSRFNVKGGLLAGILAEMAQMLIILLLSSPSENAMKLEHSIALPMMLINSLGVVIFLNIIQDMRDEYAKILAVQSQKALNITKRTITYMRKGLTKENAENVAKIIYELAGIKGIFIADKSQVLACCGEETDWNFLNNIFDEYVEKPDYKVVSIDHGHEKAHYLLAPIYVNDSEFEGVIGLKVHSRKEVDSYFLEFSKELSSLLATQMELHKLNKLAEEASTAELKALRAQIHPHFLFNTLTTIASFCRTNPMKARELIIDLSNYFRITLKREEDCIPIKEELDFINSYLSIEKARFGDRLQLHVSIPEEMQKYNIPVFVIQPIIENSIKHGILHKPEGGKVSVFASEDNDAITFTMEDTGVGMSSERLLEVTTKWPGIGLKNVNERLKLLYGDESLLKITSDSGTGTKISFSIPKEVGKSADTD